MGMGLEPRYNFSRDFLRDRCKDNLKIGSRSFSACNALDFFSVECLGVKLKFTIHIFFRIAVLRKVCDVRFSY